jgi:DNA adenine methylase Dam
MYIDSVMNYTGSKFKLLNQILPEFDFTKKNFVDVFCGGGSVYTNVVDKYDKIIINDIINDLIGIHKGLMYSDDIIESTKLLCPGKLNPEGYSKLREDYNLNPSPDKLWALMLSCTNNMVRFNQKFKFNQTYGNRGYNDNTDKKVKIFTDHIRRYVDKIEFYSRPFYDIEIYENTIYYIDPPYGRIKKIDGTIGKKQISEAGYNAFWKEDDDIKLYDFIHKINKVGSSFMVSGVLYHNGNTCWMLDKLINDGFIKKSLSFDYNKVSRVGEKETVEVIIKNY